MSSWLSDGTPNGKGESRTSDEENIPPETGELETDKSPLSTYVDVKSTTALGVSPLVNKPAREYLMDEDSDDDLDGMQTIRSLGPGSVPKHVDKISSAPGLGIRMAQRQQKSDEQEKLHLRIQVRELERLLRKKNIKPEPQLDSEHQSLSILAPEDSDDEQDRLERQQRDEALQRENQHLHSELNDLRRQMDTRSSNTFYTNASYDDLPDNAYFPPSNYTSPPYPTTQAFGAQIPSLHHPAYPAHSVPSVSSSFGHASPRRTSPRRPSPKRSSPRRLNALLPARTSIRDLQSKDLEIMNKRNQIIQDVIDGDDVMNYFGSSSETMLNQLAMRLYSTVQSVIQWDMSDEAGRKCVNALTKFHDQYGNMATDKSGHIDMLINIVGWAEASRERMLDRIQKLEDFIDKQEEDMADYDKVYDEFEQVRNEYNNIRPVYDDLKNTFHRLNEVLESTLGNYDVTKMVEHVADALEVLVNMEKENNVIRQENEGQRDSQDIQAAKYEEKIAKLQRKVSDVQKRMISSEKRNEDLIKEMEELTDRMQRTTEKIVASKQLEVEDCKREYRNAVNQLDDVKEQLEHLNIKHRQSVSDKLDLVERNEKLQSNVSKLEARSKELELQQAQHDAQNDQLREDKTKLTEQLEELHRAAETIQVRSTSGGSDTSWKNERYQQTIRLQERNKQLERENNEKNTSIKDLEKRVKANKLLSSKIIARLIGVLKPELGAEWADRTEQDLERLPEGTVERTAIKVNLIDSHLISELENKIGASHPMSDEARIWKARYEEMKGQYKNEREELQEYKIGARQQISTLRAELKLANKGKEKPVIKAEVESKA